MNTQSSYPPILLLPGELRNQIYREYLFAGTEDGYVYDFEAGKLRTANNQPIELNLMYTCKLIAREMQGLALCLHTVTFSTLYSTNLRTRAARWAYFVSRFGRNVNWRTVGQLVAPEVIREVAGARSFVHAISQYHQAEDYLSFDWDGWDQVPSVQRSLQAQLIAKAVTEPACRTDISAPPKVENFEYLWDEVELRGGLAAFLDVIREPWSIPTEDELDTIGARLPTRKQKAPAALRNMWQDHPGRFRFSAAAAAIHFLSSLPAATRKYMRTIRLCEDRVSVAHPECHIRGLVPYCLENPALRIERRADLWNNLFQTNAWGQVSGQFHDPFESGDPFEFGLIRWSDIAEDDALPADHATRPVALWMAEASHPEIPDSISLVLDGDPTPERSAEVFHEAIQRDAAWQIAKERRFNDPENAFLMRMRTAEACWHAVRFPQLLANINKPTSRIKCNFDPGQPWCEDQITEVIRTNKIAEDNLEPSSYDGRVPDLVTAWEWRRGLRFATASPLPSFWSLVEENMDPGYEERKWLPPWEVGR
ncbi:hypothetical protein QBC40DRAFT_278634 [Triangularia verruculosa]|uniref:Uncharacterized protein n=1 Tax=Triangularia verruculosa TaxID=2587418 RepID=A0AAN7AW22_9PEZI|nr:hypothetical protein QBC40DRAFT_278634 [Triangularia verruculosa]